MALLKLWLPLMSGHFEFRASPVGWVSDSSTCRYRPDDHLLSSCYLIIVHHCWLISSHYRDINFLFFSKIRCNIFDTENHIEGAVVLRQDDIRSVVPPCPALGWSWLYLHVFQCFLVSTFISSFFFCQRPFELLLHQTAQINDYFKIKLTPGRGLDLMMHYLKTYIHASIHTSTSAHPHCNGGIFEM